MWERLTLRSILLDSAVYGNIPQNSGLTRPITIVAPKGTLAKLPTAPDHMEGALPIDMEFWADYGQDLNKRFNDWLAK